jgi:hypothetical protein
VTAASPHALLTVSHDLPVRQPLMFQCLQVTQAT